MPRVTQSRHDTDPVLGGVLGAGPQGLLALHARGTILTAMGGTHA